MAFVFFGCLCAFGIWSEKPLPTYLFGTLSALGLGFILFPRQFKPAFVVWLKIAHFVGSVITTLILTFAYYMVITPAAIIKRILGGVPLPVKPDKSVQSYWVKRKEAVQPKEQFLKRF